LIFVIVMLAGLFIHKWGFIFLFLLIMVGCSYEFLQILQKIHVGKYYYYQALAIPYIVMPICLMINLGIDGNVFAKVANYSPLLPCGIIFSIWINDTMAYLVGSFIGKTPLSSISPKKTWEGTIGGALLCMVTIALFGHVIPVAKNISWQHWFHIAAICAVFGTLGDLLESKIKRMANIKDSGSFMPGHGGFLDRFDSLLVATPFVWLYIKLFL
jgi:phosphatidate cytidylyltransferase